MLNVLIGQSDRPNRISTTDKNQQYHSDFARYCIFSGFNYMHQKFVAKTKLNKQFYKGEQWTLPEDLEAFFMDDTGGVRNRIKVVKNLIRPMIEQYRGNAIRMQIKSRVKSVSPRAINRREEKLQEMMFYSKVAGKLDAENPAMAEFLRKKLPIGGSPEETEQIFDNHYVDDYVTALNYLSTFIANENRLDAKQPKIAENMALSGLGVMETYEHGGHQIFKTIESEDFFWDRSARDYNLGDAEFMGVINHLSPTEVFERWQNVTDDEREAVENYSKQFLHKFFENISENMSMSGKVPVFRTFWRDSEKYTYGYVKDEFGYPFLTKINHIEKDQDAPRYTEKDLIDPPTPRAQKIFKGKKTRPMYMDIIRFATMIPKEFLASQGTTGTTDVMLEYGISDYQEIENEKPSNVKFPFKAHCWGYVDGEVLSPVDDAINPQRFINRMMSVAENQINNSRGAGTVYDKDLVDSKEGEQEILRSINQSKPIGIRAKGRGVQNAIGSYDATVKQGTMVMFDIVNVMNSYIQQVTGVNEALKGESTGSDQLVGVTQLLLQRGSLMQEPFYNAITEIFLECYQSMITFGKMIYCENERALAISVGDKYAKTLRITRDMMPEDFRAFAFRENAEEVLVNAGNQQLIMMLQMGMIDQKRYADLYNRSTPEDIARALREAVVERAEISRLSEQDKQKKFEQLNKTIADNNRANLMAGQIAEDKEDTRIEKQYSHDLDKEVTKGIVKQSLQAQKSKSDIEQEIIKSKNQNQGQK